MKVFPSFTFTALGLTLFTLKAAAEVPSISKLKQSSTIM